MFVRIVHSCAITVILCALVGCGPAGNESKPEKVITNEEAVNLFEADLKRNLDEVDNDPKLTPQQKEETKAMMRENVKKRMESFKN